MPNIVLCRIDERLIHGQVGVQWVGFAGANLVLVANDEVADDPVQQNLMEMVLAEGIAVRFWSLQKVIDNIHRAADRQKILLVCKTPADFLTLVAGGVPITVRSCREGGNGSVVCETDEDISIVGVTQKKSDRSHLAAITAVGGALPSIEKEKVAVTALERAEITVFAVAAGERFLSFYVLRDEAEPAFHPVPDALLPHKQ